MKYLSFKKFLNIQQPLPVIFSIYLCPFEFLKEESKDTGINYINEVAHTIKYWINLERYK